MCIGQWCTLRAVGTLAMTEGHCQKMLGVWGALQAPQRVQGSALVGVQGAKPPESSVILQFRTSRNG